MTGNYWKSVRIDCAEFGCTNYQMLAPDCAIPKTPYVCTPCQDRNEALMLDELARREDARRAMLGRDIEPDAKPF